METLYIMEYIAMGVVVGGIVYIIWDREIKGER
jgi:hypothetical protein